MPEELSLDAFHRGDERLFAQLVHEHSPRLYAALRRYARRPEEADDLLQGVWLRAFEKRRTYDGRGSLVGWLFAICRTVGMAHVDRERREQTVRIETEPEAALATEQSRGADGDLERRLFDTLTALPDAHREVVWLRFIEGCSTRETARQLGCAEGTVKSRLHYALARLHQTLEGTRR